MAEWTEPGRGEPLMEPTAEEAPPLLREEMASPARPTLAELQARVDRDGTLDLSGLHVGQRVERRDRGGNEWKVGFVVGSAEPASPKSSPVAPSDHTLHGVHVRGRSWSFFSFVRNDLKAFGHHVLHGDVLFLTSKATSILGMSTRVDILVGVSATSILGMSTRVDILVGVSAVHP